MADTTHRFGPLAGGLVDSRDPSLIRDDRATEAINVEFDRETVRSAFGSAKMGNRTAPHSGIRTRVDPGLTPLSIESGVSVPVRGYVMLPYAERYDIGAERLAEGGAIGSGSERFHTQRGKSFSISFSVRIPKDEKLHGLRNGSDSGPINNPADADVILIQSLGGYDIAIDDCCLFTGKGGDRMAPLSWAVGLVNVGDKFEYATGSDWRGETRYVPVFMWLDASGWSYHGPSFMEYTLTSGQQIGAGEDQYSTTALRAIVAERALVPGEDYHLSFDLDLDTGDAGDGTTPSPTWQGDGSFRITVGKALEDPTTHDEETGLHVWKGPPDSIGYLEKYGVRYHGRDAMFCGTGMRQSPFMPQGFLATGADGAALEKGGHKMLDFSAHAPPTGHTLTASRGAGENFLEFNHQYLSSGNTEGGASHIGLNGADFLGLQFNGNALVGYWAILYNDGFGDKWNGARFRLGTYGELAGPTRYVIDGGVATLVGAFAARPVAIVPFRWRQFEFVMSSLTIHTKGRDFIDPRAQFSLRSYPLLDDETEGQLAIMVAHWPMTDAEGAALEETVAGSTGFLMPFGLGEFPSGRRGGNVVALSGEGEAIFLDLADDPSLKRELELLLRKGDRGMAIEVTCTFPEATYARDLLVGSNYEAKYGGDVLSWEVRDQSETGVDHAARPLLRLTQRARWSTAATTAPARLPLGFQAWYSANTDQEDAEESELFSYQNRWSADAAWVGKPVTFQIGLQPTTTADEYEIYLAFTPAADLVGSEGSTSQSEATIFATGQRIEKKDILRSVITIGGAWNPEGLRGYTELNSRMLVEEVRVFASSAPGNLPASSGETIVDGKILGERAYPARELEADELSETLGLELEAVDVVQGDATLVAPGQSRFWEGDPNDTRESLTRTLVAVAGDRVDTPRGDGLFDSTQEIYRVGSVPAGGQSSNLDRAYLGITRSSALAKAFRLAAYTTFADRTTQRDLSIGSGRGYDPATATSEDASVSEPLWFNPAVPSCNWRVRIYSPLTRSALRDILPSWTRGAAIARRNPSLGIHTQDSTVYSLHQGSLYEADDRWRANGPEDTTQSCLAFVQEGDHVCMLGSDGFFDPELEDYWANQFTYYDAWLLPGDTSGTRTVHWVGDLKTDPTRVAGPDGHRVQVWTRVRDGRPEFCVASTQTWDGTSIPDDGLFIATALPTLASGAWTHVRWALFQDDLERAFQEPRCFINGQPVEVTVNARGFLLSSPDWITDVASNFPSPALMEQPVTLFGAAPTAKIVQREDGGWTEDEASGPDAHPNLETGLGDTFDGCISSVSIGTGQSNDPGTFDPYNPGYDVASSAITLMFDDGIGHVAFDLFSTIHLATIFSHPFISRFHEAGRSTKRASFANYLDQVYIANGGRVLVADSRIAKHAGVLPPTTRPTSELKRRPVFLENVQVDSPDGSENGPIDSAAAGASPRLWHLQSHGNVYWRQRWDPTLSWEHKGSNESNDYDVFGFKCYVRMRSVSGRIPLWSSRSSTRSGSIFVEIRDGRLFVGWWDVNLKEEVSIGTSRAEIEPGVVTYIEVRKVFPRQSGWLGVYQNPPMGGDTSNWYNSIYSHTNAETLDKIVIRQFQKQGGSVFDQPLNAATVHATARNIVSYTTDEITKPAGTTASGLVSVPDRTYTGGAAGVIAADTGTPFHRDMLGRYFQIGTGGGAFAGKLLRIAGYTSSSALVLAELDGTLPDLTAVVGANGGVFLGTSLIKSGNFDDSTAPDPGNYDVELFGSSLAGDPDSGIAPFNGEWWSVAYGIERRDGDEDVGMFEPAQSDRIETGGETFPQAIYLPSGAPDPGPGELRCNGGRCHTEVSCQPYLATIQPVSPEPNSDGQVQIGPQSGEDSRPIEIAYMEAPGSLLGAVRVAVVFYDPEQRVRSNPSPELVIQPQAEDSDNPSNDLVHLISGLPVSRSTGPIERWIYASVPGGIDKFRVAIVPDNSSTAVAVRVTGASIDRRELLEYNNGPPPECSVLGAANDALWFGALRDDDELVQWSRRFFPAQVPRVNLLPMVSGGSGPVTAIFELKGRAVIFKRDWMTRVTLGTLGPQTEVIAGGAGALSDQSVVPMDDHLEFMGDRGVYVYSGQGGAFWVAPNLKVFFTEQARIDRGPDVSAAISRRRNQYVATVFEHGVLDRGQRISSEFDSGMSGAGLKSPAQYRFSRYEDPWITAIAELQDEAGGVQELVGGTDEGFCVRMDRLDGRQMQTGVWQLTAGSPAPVGSSRVSIDTAVAEPGNELEGVRGAPVRWAGGYATALVYGAGRLYLDRAVSNQPAEGDPITIGVQSHLWSSRWHSFETPEDEKAVVWAYLVGANAGSGTAWLEVYVDFDDDEYLTRCEVDLSDEHVRVRVAGGPHHHWKFTLRSKDPAEPVRFEIAQLLVRVQSTEQVS
ncbi:MAG: hypothetical protein GY719_23675 [bacterium]|nr:hypothetical protein [bacterium]